MKLRKLIAGVMLASLSLTALAPAASAANVGGDDSQSTVERLVAMNAKNGQFDTLINAVLCTGTDATLAAASGYTLFAPTDGAFAQLGLNPDNVCATPGLGTILGYHVYAGGEVDFATAKTLRGISVPMLTGVEAAISGQGNVVRVDGAQVIKKDIDTSDGLVHVLNRVMLP